MKNDEFTIHIHCWGEGHGSARIDTGHMDRTMLQRLARALPHIGAILEDEDKIAKDA